MSTKYQVRSSFVKALGFKSKLETIVNKQLIDMGAAFAYEGALNTIRYVIPSKEHRYVSDFLLSNGIIIEAKGFFTLEDRKKHLFIKEQYPILDIRFLFINSNNKISKRSKTTYKDWCNKKGFLYADKIVPKVWVEELKPKEELDKIISLLEGFNKCTNKKTNKQL